MTATTLVVSAALQVVTALAFVAVARRVAATPRGDPKARRHLVIWWAGMAGYLAIHGLVTASAASRATPIGIVFATTRFLTVPFIVVAITSLVLYLAYLIAGHHRYDKLVLAVYAVASLAYAYGVFLGASPVVVRDWLVEGTSSAPLQYSYIAFGLPPIAASLAYIVTSFSMGDAESRIRARLIGVALLTWVGSGLTTRLQGDDAATFFALVVVGIAAAGLVFAAYYPPRILRRFIAYEAERDVARSQRNESFRSRIHELV